MQTPDITPAQLVAVINALGAVAVAFIPGITSEQSVAIMGLAAAVSGLLIHGDAKIRKARNDRVGRQNTDHESE